MHSHKPMNMVLELGRFVPLFYNAVCRNEQLDKIEIFWPAYTQCTKAGPIYFVTVIYPVKISFIRQYLPNVKDPEFYNYGHLIEVSFRYRWIEWEYTKGKHWVKKEWNNFISDIFHTGDERECREMEAMLSESALTDNLQLNDNNREISVHAAGWEHLDEYLKESRPQKVSKGNKIRLFAEVNGISDGEAVRFELYYKTPEEKCAQFTEVSGKVENGIAAADWEVDLWGIKGKEYQIWFEPVARGRYGDKCRIELVKRILVPWFVDCHCHINAPKCAPLPSIWVQSFFAKILKPSWATIETNVMKWIISWFQHELAKYTPMSTRVLGDMLLTESESVLKSREFDEYMGPPKNRKRLHVLMPMDMELANYSGYDGKTVYQLDERGRPGYWCYEKEGERKWYPLEKKGTERIETYKSQIIATQEFCKSCDNLALPFFHYDPRRWQGIPNQIWSGKWNKPFNYIIQISEQKKYLNDYAAIGFKMYTAQGYRPDDYKDRLVYNRSSYKQKKTISARLPDMRNFYGECQKYNIPIICHGSEGGIFVHDYMLYYDYLFPADEVSNDEKLEFLRDVFVSPWAWESVLHDFPDLHLCLAHFGGKDAWNEELSKPHSWVMKMVQMMEKYKNFYVDLSYFIFGEDEKDRKREQLEQLLISHPKIKTKLLFGTDWYLTSSEKPEFGSYSRFVKSMCFNLSVIDAELLAYCMVLNPKKFLQLEYIAERINDLFSPKDGILELVKRIMPDNIEQFSERV